jgi:luciferase family oxidoreductase group 1
MLPHYSSYKVAEQFSVLANLYPGRIDLGLGRAPGADMSTVHALSTDGGVHFHEFPEKVESLCNYLWNPGATPLVSPKPPHGIPVWILGSSSDSAIFAAQRGLPYNLGAFINPDASPMFTQLYRDNFQASELFPEPKVILTLGVFCAEDSDAAETHARTFDLNFFRFITGQEQSTFLSPEQAARYPDSVPFQMFRQRQNKTTATGTPSEVKNKLLTLADQFQADEVMAVTNMYDFEARKTSFRLLKSAFA